MPRRIKIKIFVILQTFLMLIFTMPVYAATYIYDDANRLTTVTYDNGAQVQYTYDNAGNRLTAHKTGFGNLLKNPGFERYSGNTGVGDRWSKVESSGITGTYQIVNNYVKSGIQAQKISATGLNNEQTIGVMQTVAVQPYQAFELKGALRVDSLNQAKAKLFVEFHSATNQYIGGKVIEQSQVTNGYVTLQGQGVVPGNATKALIQIAISGTGANGSGTIYADDIEFKINQASLQVTSTSPEEGAEQVNPLQPIVITLTKPVTAGSEYSDIVLKQGDQSIESILQIEQNILTITPTQPLELDHTFKLNMPKDAIKDAEGNELESPLTLTFATNSVDGNLLLNSGFEQYTGNSGVADDWNSRQSDGVDSTFEIVDTSVQSGLKAQKMNVAGLREDDSVALYQDLEIEPADSFELSGLINVESLNGARMGIQVNFYNSTGEYLDGKFIELSQPSASYVNLHDQGAIPLGASKASVQVLITGTADDGVGIIYVDNLFFKTAITPVEAPETLPESTPELKDILLNPEFDQYTGTEGIADDWNKLVSDETEAIYEMVNEPLQSGVQAQKISVTGLEEGKSVAVYQEVSASPDQSFVLNGSLFVQSLLHVDIAFHVDFYDATDTLVGSKVITQSEVTEGYVTLQDQGVTPSNSVKAVVNVTIKGSASDGAASVVIDHLHFNIRQEEQEIGKYRNKLKFVTSKLSDGVYKYVKK